MKKIFLLVFFGLNTILINAQFGVNGGLSFLKPFGQLKPFIGFHVGGEVPRDDANSIYGRIAFYAKQSDTQANSTFVEANDPSTSPYFQTITFNNSINYTILEGGNRYYIGDGYDAGFGAYGGGNVAIVFNTIKRTYSDYDQSKYSLSSTDFPKGSIFNVGVGLGGGVKHTLAGIGTVYLDANFTYLIMSIPSNSTASIAAGPPSNMYSPLLFSFNLGFRKDLY